MNKVEKILSWYSSTSTFGQLKNLSRIFNYGRLSGSGKLLILPVDQNMEHGPGRSFEINPIMYDPINQAKLAIDAGVNAYAAPLGSLERAQELILRHNLPTILKVNAHHLMIPDDENPKLSVHSWVDDAVRLGCEAVGFTLYPGSSYSNEMEEQARELISDARKAGLAVILWVYPRGGGILKGQETATDIISYGAALGANLGAHIIKVKLPAIDGYGLESNKKLDIYINSPTETLEDRVRLVMKAVYDGHRVVIHSGGDTKDDQSVFDEIRAFRDAGAFGSIMGRNAFQRPYDDAVKFLNKVQDILLEEK